MSTDIENFIKYCQYGYTNDVKIYIENNFNIDSFNEHNLNGLYYACVNRHLDVVKILIDNNANLNLRCPNGQTIFMKICKDLNYFRSRKRDLNDRRKLMYEEQIEIINYIIDKGGDGNNISEKSIYQENIEIINYLIDKGGNVNEKDNNGITILEKCIEELRYNTVKILLENGADANVKNSEGKTPLEILCREYFPSLENIHLLQDNYFRLGMNMEAHSFYNDEKIRIIDLLIEYTDQLDFKCRKSGYTVLIYKIKHERNIDINDINSIIDKTKHLNKIDKNGRTALIHACIKGRRDIIEKLLERNVDVNIKDKYKKNYNDYLIENNDRRDKFNKMGKPRFIMKLI